MAKERMINTRIWSDSWVSILDPLEKLLFLYFLTNTYTNISGIYELPMKIAAVETGIDPSMFEKMLPHLEPKVIYKHGWVILPNFTKYQNTENPKIMAGIQRELAIVPKEIHTLSIAYGYPIALIPIPIPILNSTKPNLTDSDKPLQIVSENEKMTKGSQEVVLSFREVNPSWKTLVERKPQHEAARRLIETHGLQQVLGVIRILPETNKMPYFTPITTPIQLEDNWAKLEAKIAQKRGEKTKGRGRGFSV